MNIIITDCFVKDVRFPTSDFLDGSDAVHVDPDYSAVYVTLKTNIGLEGNGLAFTCGRGNEICCFSAESYGRLIVGRSLQELTIDFGSTWNALANDSQLRWLGPQKGATHMAMGAVINAVWDLWAKSLNKPLWKLIADMSPEEIVNCIDFSWMSDALTPDEALVLMNEIKNTRDQRIDKMMSSGYPAYTTSAGWLGYSDEKIRSLCKQGIDAGWNHFKIKVGVNLDDDRRRCDIVRKSIGPNRKLMIDANQCWDVNQAIQWVNALSEFDPWWIEEPTSPDDILGHARIAKAVHPVGVATGEACQNRVIFKQMFQSNAISFCQLDACRLAGLNEVLAVMLLAAKYNIPVCPHAGGVGLCEYVNHIVMIDYICISGSLENRIAEYVDHLHEHFEYPCLLVEAHYFPPIVPGYGVTMKQTSVEAFIYPHGKEWINRDIQEHTVKV